MPGLTGQQLKAAATGLEISLGRLEDLARSPVEKALCVCASLVQGLGMEKGLLNAASLRVNRQTMLQ
jgi:hypothetical protein